MQLMELVQPCASGCITELGNQHRLLGSLEFRRRETGGGCLSLNYAMIL